MTKLSQKEIEEIYFTKGSNGKLYHSKAKSEERRAQLKKERLKQDFKKTLSTRASITPQLYKDTVNMLYLSL